MAKSRLYSTGHVAIWGYLESREAYWRALSDCDVVISTAEHEFFGVSVVEAVSMGCVPLLPHRLAYPELLVDESQSIVCLYRTLTQMRKQLKRWICSPEKLRRLAADSFLAAYSETELWTETKPWLKKALLTTNDLKKEFIKLFVH